MELGPHGIRVNVVSPGYIDVRGWSDAFPDRASDELRDALVQAIPLGKAGHPLDVARAVAFPGRPGSANRGREPATFGLRRSTATLRRLRDEEMPEGSPTFDDTGWSNAGWSNAGWANAGWANAGWSNAGWANVGWN
jgi:hypothetical protein